MHVYYACANDKGHFSSFTHAQTIRTCHFTFLSYIRYDSQNRHAVKQWNIHLHCFAQSANVHGINYYLLRASCSRLNRSSLSETILVCMTVMQSSWSVVQYWATLKSHYCTTNGQYLAGIHYPRVYRYFVLWPSTYNSHSILTFWARLWMRDLFLWHLCVHVYTCT